MPLYNDEKEKIITTRAGVIPYTIVNKQLYFLLGIDFDSGDLTDFGGGRHWGGVHHGLNKSFNWENSLQCAIREFKEESNAIFPKKYYTEDFFEKSVVIVDEKIAIFFVYIDNTWFENARPKFEKKKKFIKKREIQNIIWFHENAFRKIILYDNKEYLYRMWSKLRVFAIKDIDSVISSIRTLHNLI